MSLEKIKITQFTSSKNESKKCEEKEYLNIAILLEKLNKEVSFTYEQVNKLEEFTNQIVDYGIYLSNNKKSEEQIVDNKIVSLLEDLYIRLSNSNSRLYNANNTLSSQLTY